ncbi:MAG: hypothetical protein KJZ83_23115 [Burkholderiaceae bacterium]|nr:hypothetical protein [Burkholderiaceae bacterium]
MSKFLSTLQGHEIHETLGELQNQVQNARQRARDNLEDRAAIDRIGAAGDYISAVVEAAQPLLVPVTQLGKAKAQLDTAVNALTAFCNEGASEQLTAANTAIDTALVQIAGVPVARTPAEVDALRTANTALRQSVGQHVRYMNHDLEQVQARVASAEDRAKSAEGKAAEIQTAIQESLKAAEAMREEIAKKFDQAEAAREKAIQVRIAELAAEFQAAREAEAKEREEWDNQAGEEFKAWETSVKALLAESRKQAADERQVMKEEAAKLLEAIEQHKAEAGKLVGIIGNTALAGGYQEQANRSGKAARRWHGVAVGALIAIAVHGYFALDAQPSSVGASVADRGWFWLGKILVAVPLAFLANYSARQAARASANATRYRRMELELQSIGPYLDTLPDDKAIELKNELASKFFGAPDVTTSRDDQASDAPPAKLLDIIQQLIGVLMKKI